jgi:spore coat polysaccharide biosynthesis predicted glycosyltransferase SpsG
MLSGDYERIRTRRFMLDLFEEENEDYVDTELVLTYNRYKGSIYEVWAYTLNRTSCNRLVVGTNYATIRDEFDKEVQNVLQRGYKLV